MKVRFYVDVPSHGVRVNNWPLVAWTSPAAAVLIGNTRVAFDVDMPPDLVLPPHDVMAPAGAAATVEVGEE